MDPLVLAGGALALYLISQNASASGGGSSAFIPDLDVTQQPKKFVGNSLNTYVGPVEQSYDTYDYTGITCYADWRYIENALEALGYDVDSIPKDNINSLVYSLSVYTWYYQLQSIGKKDESFILDDTGAYGVIDTKMIGWGFKKIGMGSVGRSDFHYRLNQPSYIMGNAQVGAFVAVAMAVVNGLVSAYNWLQSNGFWDDIVSLFDKPNDIVRKYFMDVLGMDEANATTISDPIYPGHGYWDSALMFTDYLIANPSFYASFTPKYK